MTDSTRSLSIAALTVDCTDVALVSGFWAKALGLDFGDGNPFMQKLSPGPSSPVPWLFLAVPEGKTVKNRLHVDLRCADREAEVARLVGLGAGRVADKNEWGLQWTIMTDPEGNEFCVSDSH